MEKYFIVYLCSSGALLAFILYTLVNLRKAFSTTIKLAAQAAREANFINVKLAKYILADLNDKKSKRDLTPEEQDFFHESRETIYKFEQWARTQVSQK